MLYFLLFFGFLIAGDRQEISARLDKLIHVGMSREDVEKILVRNKIPFKIAKNNLGESKILVSDMDWMNQQNTSEISLVFKDSTFLCLKIVYYHISEDDLQSYKKQLFAQSGIEIDTIPALGRVNKKTFRNRLVITDSAGSTIEIFHDPNIVWYRTCKDEH